MSFIPSKHVKNAFSTCFEGFYKNNECAFTFGTCSSGNTCDSCISGYLFDYVSCEIDAKTCLSCNFT